MEEGGAGGHAVSSENFCISDNGENDEVNKQNKVKLK